MKSVIVGQGSRYLRICASSASDVIAQLRIDALTATTPVVDHYAHRWGDLTAFFDGMASDWRGWSGTREWSSLERDLSLSARHRGHVELHVTVREHNEIDGWQAGATIQLEAGEQLRRVAAELHEVLRQP